MKIQGNFCKNLKRLLRQELNGLNMEITRLIDAQKKSDRELELQNQEIMRRRRSDTDHQIDFEKEREKHMRDIDLKEVSIFLLNYKP